MVELANFWCRVDGAKLEVLVTSGSDVKIWHGNRRKTHPPRLEIPSCRQKVVSSHQNSSARRSSLSARIPFLFREKHHLAVHLELHEATIKRVLQFECFIHMIRTARSRRREIKAYLSYQIGPQRSIGFLVCQKAADLETKPVAGTKMGCLR